MFMTWIQFFQGGSRIHDPDPHQNKMDHKYIIVTVQLTASYQFYGF